MRSWLLMIIQEGGTAGCHRCKPRTWSSDHRLLSKNIREIGEGTVGRGSIPLCIRKSGTGD